MAAVTIHRSPIEGRWYPCDAAPLRDLLESVERISMERTGAFLRRGARAFVVPHAAPMYSGVVASAVYRHLRAMDVRRVVLLGFSHRRQIDGVAAPCADAIETPLGRVEIDRQAAALFRAVTGGLCDHSVDIQIPYLQRFAPGACVVPLYVGELDDAERREAAGRLRALLDDGTVVIASSDLTHYGRDFRYVPFPHDQHTGERIRSLDMQAIAAAGSLDAEMFAAELRRSGATVCGSWPIQLLLETLSGLPGDLYQETLDYETSGEMTHDFENSVSYGALGWFGWESWRLEPAAEGDALARARRALDRFQRTGEEIVPQPAAHPDLVQRGRAFVTLLAGDRVRGCIGRFEHPVELAGGIPALAVEAAQDGRFERVHGDEHLQIEVHILTPPKLIRDTGSFEAGLHGAFLRAARHGGLLLPGVATRYGLSHGRFLEELARKASLPANIYSTDSFELSIFRDHSFEE